MTSRITDYERTTGSLVDTAAPVNLIGTGHPYAVGAAAMLTAANKALSATGHRTTGTYAAQNSHRTPGEWARQGNHRTPVEWLQGVPSRNRPK